MKEVGGNDLTEFEAGLYLISLIKVLGDCRRAKNVNASLVPNYHAQRFAACFPVVSALPNSVTPPALCNQKFMTLRKYLSCFAWQ